MQDIEQARKNQKVQETQLEQLKQELMTEKKQNEAFSKKIHELESHREYLMDKVSFLFYYSFITFNKRWNDFMPTNIKLRTD